jgi:ferrochelatase
LKPGVLAINFGGPTSDAELVPFLRNLLADVLPGPPFVKQLLASRLAPMRADRVRARYAEIGWSPTTRDTTAQAAGLAERLSVPVAAGMMFTPPSVERALGELLAQGVTHVIAAGLFPHWSFATSGSAGDQVHDALKSLGRQDVVIHHLRPFFDDPQYLEAVAGTVRRMQVPGDGPLHLLFSAHGIPLSLVRKGDPYPDHVRATARGVVRALGWDGPWHLGWQSRLGPTKWLEPSTPQVLRRLGAEGVRRLLVVPVSFVGEHIETLHELDIEYAELAHEAGITTFRRAPALGLDPTFLDALAARARAALAQLDRTTCVRCLVPVKPDHHAGTCRTCGFQPPAHLRG